jgi:ribosome biogenesis GTPase
VDVSHPNDSLDLASLGLTDRERALFATCAEKGLELARVSRVDRGLPLIVSERGVERAEPATHLLKSASDSASRAVVGDWVAFTRLEGHEMPIIEAILPRKSCFSRKDPGDAAGEQVLISNVDVVLVVQSLSGDGVNLRRLERELVMAWESGGVPVVVLTKADLVADPEHLREAVEQVAFGVDVVVESAVTGMGIEEVRRHVPEGVTAAILGGSGVGKSTLINRLVGEDVLATREVRAVDDKGRHTTVAREMVPISEGGVIIDTPGMRAIALWDAEDGMEAAFPDIERLAALCRFGDCAHESEPGCAVIAAVEADELPARRLESYKYLKAEMAATAQRREEKARRDKKAADKTLSKVIKQFYEHEPTRRGK